MTLPLGAKCIKYLLFTFNILCVVSGIILIAIGSVIKTPYSAYHYILDHGFFAIPVLLIFIGIITFIVSFFGCCGALKENYCLIVTFLVSLVLIFILEISGGIAGYVLKDKVSEALKGDLLDSIKHYNSSIDIQHMWDLAQSKLKCCGALNKTDWNDFLPDSCCKPTPKNPLTKCTVALAYNTSCYGLLKESFTSNAVTLGGAGLGVAIIQLLGILFSYSLARSFGKQYETLEKD